MNRHSARDYKRPRRGPGDGIRARDFAMGLALGLAVAVIVFTLDHRGSAGPHGQRVAPQAAVAASGVNDPAGVGNAGSSTRLVGRKSASHRSSSHKQTNSSAPATAVDPPESHPAAGNVPPGDSAAGNSGRTQSNSVNTAGSATGEAVTNAAAASDTAGSAAAVGKFDFYQMLPRFEVVIPEREHGSRPAPSAQIDPPGSYFLQVGSYREAAVAEHVRAEVVRLGIGASVQRIAVDNDVWHRVRVGPIHDVALLNRLRRQLQASNLDSLVIRVDN